MSCLTHQMATTYYLEDYCDLDHDQFHDIEYHLDEPIGHEYQQQVRHIPGLRRGDLISLVHDQYRNTDVLIWDGQKAIPLAGEPDEYGCIPRSFSVITEFPLDYWKDQIAHNE